MPHGHDEDKETFCKVVSFWSIGILTLVYCIGELGAGVYLQSLTLLSDGFHNLSDVASLYVAYWALKVASIVVLICVCLCATMRREVFFFFFFWKLTLQIKTRRPRDLAEMT